MLQSDEPLIGTNIQVPSRAPELPRLVPAQPTTPPIAVKPAHKPLTEAGVCLLGISEPADGDVFRLGFGETLIGRFEHCHIVSDDATFSTEHAGLKVRPEGLHITNLISVNGVKINGKTVRSTHLNDGDKVGFG